MNNIIIWISWGLTIYLFYNLIKIRTNEEKIKRLNKIYVLIVLILIFIIIWNVFR